MSEGTFFLQNKGNFHFSIKNASLYVVHIENERKAMLELDVIHQARTMVATERLKFHV